MMIISQMVRVFIYFNQQYATLELWFTYKNKKGLPFIHISMQSFQPFKICDMSKFGKGLMMFGIVRIVGFCYVKLELTSSNNNEPLNLNVCAMRVGFAKPDHIPYNL